MMNFDLPTFLVAFAVGLAAMWTLVLTVRSSTRSHPRLSLSGAVIGAGGLALTLRNEGLAPASGIELRVSGEHDGTILFHHDALGVGGAVTMTDACPAGSHFVVELLYRHTGGVGFTAQRTLRRSGTGPLRIVSATDLIVTRRWRDWASDMLSR